MPDLTEREATDNAVTGSIGLVNAGEYLRGQGDGAGIWEDEDERRFYENLIDLKGRVPAILLEEGKKNLERRTGVRAFRLGTVRGDRHRAVFFFILHVIRIAST